MRSELKLAEQRGRREAVEFFIEAFKDDEKRKSVQRMLERGAADLLESIISDAVRKRPPKNTRSVREVKELWFVSDLWRGIRKAFSKIRLAFRGIWKFCMSHHEAFHAITSWLLVGAHIYIFLAVAGH